MTPRQRAFAGTFLAVISLLFVASAAVVLVFDGYSFRVGPLRLSSHNLWRDLALAIAAAAAALVLRGRTWFETRARMLLIATERAAPWIAGIVSMAVVAVAWIFGTHCACASDAYGYVSQAALWAVGTLHVDEPLAAVVPWPNPEWILSPLGYRPATYPGAIVPTYASGFPLTMALAFKVARTSSAMFAVVPILGALAVWCTYQFGRRLDTASTGMWAALLLASSPTFLFQLMLPMSDLPAAAWWAAAAVLLFRETDLSAFFSGLAVSAAVLTRPNLVPLVAIFVLYQLGGSVPPASRLRRTFLFSLGALPGAAAVGWIQNVLYGSPLTSGYGKVRDLYSLSNVGSNMRLYPRWLAEAHGPFIFLALASPLFWLRRTSSLPTRTRRMASFAFVLIAAVFLAYVAYSSFDNWTYTRFLLPAFPFAIVSSVWTAAMLGRRLGSPLVQAVVALVVIFVVLAWMRESNDRLILQTARGERRYIEAARFAARTTPDDAIVLAMQHSGSVRYYAARTTIRYDWLPESRLDEAILFLQRIGRRPILVLDDWEEPQFKRRFAGQKWGALDWPPRAEVESQPVVRVYDPFDRDRYHTSQRIPTVRLPLPKN